MKEQLLLTEIQLFLTRYAQQERRLSRETILSYRDTMKLFILFQRDELGRSPAKLGLDALSYQSVVKFLDYLEKNRGVSVSTRNQRLCALKSLGRYLMFRHPDHADTIARSLMVPMKKRAKKARNYLKASEVSTLLKTIDQSTWIGQRDFLMFDLSIKTGLRVSELIALRPDSFTFGKAPYVTVEGKGRKERSVPLDKPTSKALSHWISNGARNDSSYLFSTTRGERMSTDAVQHALRKYVEKAAEIAPSLRKKKVSPHTLRHTTAMQLLDRGVDVQIIALWLGHEQIETTQVYLSESLALKRKALKKTRLTTEWIPPKQSASVLSFLDAL